MKTVHKPISIIYKQLIEANMFSQLMAALLPVLSLSIHICTYVQLNIDINDIGMRIASLSVTTLSIHYMNLNIDIIDIKRIITNDMSHWILCRLQLHPDLEQLWRLWHNCLLMFMAFGCWTCVECVDSWRPKTQAEKN